VLRTIHKINAWIGKPPTPLFVVGIARFDGTGGFTQVDYIGDSLRTRGLTDFSTGETATYKVNSDPVFLKPGAIEIDRDVADQQLFRPGDRRDDSVIGISAAKRVFAVHSSFRRDSPNPSPPKLVLTVGRSGRSRTTEAALRGETALLCGNTNLSHSVRREKTMKRAGLCAIGIGVLVSLGPLAVEQGYAGDHEGKCTLATLKGRYLFAGLGTLFPPAFG
jgi:hypothetical protein